MALLLDIWTALVLGIMYLTFQAFPIVFGTNHGFNEQSTGLSFLGIGIGLFIGLSSQPYWNRRVNCYRYIFWTLSANRLFDRQMTKFDGKPPPETRLYMGQLGGLLVPIGKMFARLIGIEN
jgi:hypothetical protein